jgi:Putative capsular polysaccharide synthesis protein
MYLILQHGKVASLTIEWSIRHSDETARIERHHFLSDEVISDIGRVCHLETIHPTGIPASDIASARNQMLAAQRARDEILNSDQPIFVLTGFRDPIDLAISAFFQNVTTFCPGLTFDPRRIHVETARIAEVFNREFDQFLNRMNNGVPAQTFAELILDLKFEDYTRWLDREFRGVLGVDVFNHQVGTKPMRFRQGRFTVLLYRVETLSRFLPELLRQLPLPKQPVISNENIGSTKIYGPLYAKFRERFVPSAAMLEYYYGARYFSHFYGGLRPLYSASL